MKKKLSLTNLQENYERLFEDSTTLELVKYSNINSQETTENILENIIGKYLDFFNLKEYNTKDIFDIKIEQIGKINKNVKYLRTSLKINFAKNNFNKEELVKVYFLISYFQKYGFEIINTGIELKNLEGLFKKINCENGICKIKENFLLDLHNLLKSYKKGEIEQEDFKIKIYALIDEIHSKINNIDKQIEKNKIKIDDIIDFNKTKEELDKIFNEILTYLENRDEDKLTNIIKGLDTNISFFSKIFSKLPKNIIENTRNSVLDKDTINYIKQALESDEKIIKLKSKIFEENQYKNKFNIEFLQIKELLEDLTGKLYCFIINDKFEFFQHENKIIENIRNQEILKDNKGEFIEYICIEKEIFEKQYLKIRTKMSGECFIDEHFDKLKDNDGGLIQDILGEKEIFGNQYLKVQIKKGGYYYIDKNFERFKDNDGDVIKNVLYEEKDVFGKKLFYVESEKSGEYFIDENLNKLKDDDGEIIVNIGEEKNIFGKKYLIVKTEKSGKCFIDENFNKLKDENGDIITNILGLVPNILGKTYLKIETKKFGECFIDENFNKLKDENGEAIINILSLELNILGKTYLKIKTKKFGECFIDKNFNKLKDNHGNIIRDIGEKKYIFGKIYLIVEIQQFGKCFIDENFNKLKDKNGDIIIDIWEEENILGKKYLEIETKKFGKCFIDENFNKLKNNDGEIIETFYREEEFLGQKLLYVRGKDSGMFYIDENRKKVEKKVSDIIEKITDIIKNKNEFYEIFELVNNINGFFAGMTKNIEINQELLDLLKKQKIEIKKYYFDKLKTIEIKQIDKVIQTYGNGEKTSKDLYIKKHLEKIKDIIEKNDFNNVEIVYSKIQELFEKINYSKGLENLRDFSKIDFNLFTKENIKKIESLKIEKASNYYDYKIYDEYYKDTLNNPYNRIKLSNYGIKEIYVSNNFINNGKISQNTIDKIIRRESISLDSKSEPRIHYIGTILEEFEKIDSYKKELETEIQEFNNSSNIQIIFNKEVNNFPFFVKNEKKITNNISDIINTIHFSNIKAIIDFFKIEKIILIKKESYIENTDVYFNITSEKTILEFLREKYYDNQI